jgi:hypothetical protein
LRAQKETDPFTGQLPFSQQKKFTGIGTMAETKVVVSSAMEEVLDIIPPVALSAEAQGLAPGRARLAGKRIIVVGGGQAINDFDPNPPVGNGRAISVLLAREGATVAVVDRSLLAAQATVDLIEQ